MMIGQYVLLGFLGPPGVREIVIVAFVAFLLYGRSGVMRGLQKTRYGRVIGPWMSTARPAAEPSPARAKARRESWGDRWFWLLAATAVTAVAAWVVTRLLIGSAATSR
jgi:hypothetical protein